MSNKILILPDIHGRIFWKGPCKNIEKYDKVIFLGDYLDPYELEHIKVEDAVVNFKEIIDFKKQNKDKVVLLLGNHDMPYAFKDYYHFSSWHCRHAEQYHNEIANLFRTNINLFQIAFVYKDILFTHAGVESEWLEDVVGCKSNDINEIADALNHLTEDKDGLLKLYKISDSRGGRDYHPSCIWADVEDIKWDVDADDENEKPIHRIRQVFGHTLQALYNKDGKIEYCEPYQFELCKMLDCARAYVLDAKTFRIKEFNTELKGLLKDCCNDFDKFESHIKELKKKLFKYNPLLVVHLEKAQMMLDDALYEVADYVN